MKKKNRLISVEVKVMCLEQKKKTYEGDNEVGCVVCT